MGAGRHLQGAQRNLDACHGHEQNCNTARVEGLGQVATMAANCDRIPLTSGALCVAMRPAKKARLLQKYMPIAMVAKVLTPKRKRQKRQKPIQKSYQGVINADAAQHRHAASHNITSSQITLLHACVETSTTVTVMASLTHVF
jgi:hypothetical protein